MKWREGGRGIKEEGRGGELIRQKRFEGGKEEVIPPLA
jgi:hypothetical protein